MKLPFPSASLAFNLTATFCLLLTSTLLADPPPQIQPETSDSLSAKVAEALVTVASKESSSVVRVRCFDGHGEVVGTGFYIDPTGTICTLAEIVEGAHDITIEQNGKTNSAKLLALDPRTGIAFLKSADTNVSGNAGTFLPPRPFTNATVFTPVISMGYPREQPLASVLGTINGTKNHEGDRYFCVTHLSVSIPLLEGEGGSPILDLSGNLLGVVITGNPQLGNCTILPSNAIEQLHQNLLRYGAVAPGWVGAMVELAAVPEHKSRTRIVSVEPGGPAEAAGIRAGDTLVAIGNHAICNPEDILDSSFYLTVRESVQVIIVRDGVPQTLTLQCGEYPTEGNAAEISNQAKPTAFLEQTHP